MAQLNKGDKAPQFEIKDAFDEIISLNNYKGKRLMLSFYRYASCPLCNLRINEVIGKYDDWTSKNFETIAVFQSPKARVNEYVGKQDAPFPIIPDDDLKLYKLYGVEGSWRKMMSSLNLKKMTQAFKKGFFIGKSDNEFNMIPADFLIDEQGIIQHAFYGKNIGDHLPTHFIEAFIN